LIWFSACWPRPQQLCCPQQALLLALIARGAIGMPAGMVREDALIAASVMIAAVAGMPSRKRKQ
jgi:hypothetical protein